MEDHEAIQQQADRYYAAYRATGDEEMKRRADIFAAQARNLKAIFDAAKKHEEAKAKADAAQNEVDAARAQRQAEIQARIDRGNAALEKALKEAREERARADEARRRRDDPHGK